MIESAKKQIEAAETTILEDISAPILNESKVAEDVETIIHKYNYKSLTNLASKIVNLKIK